MSQDVPDTQGRGGADRGYLKYHYYLGDSDSDQEIPGPPNRDPDSRFRPNRESGIPCFPIPAESGIGNRRFPRFPEKNREIGGVGNPIF